MKNIILLILTTLIMMGCDIRTEETKKGNFQTEKSFFDTVKENRHIQDSIEQEWHGYELVVIDGCEYLKKELIGYKKAAFETVHKGNCRFCKERDSIKWERRKKELEELVIKLKGK